MMNSLNATKGVQLHVESKGRRINSGGHYRDCKSLQAEPPDAKVDSLVEGKEFPARPLLLNAAGVPPNDSTNSHQAVAILKERGFETRYEGKPV